MSPVSFEVAAGIAILTTAMGLWIAWQLVRQFHELARLKAAPDLHDLYAAIQHLITPLSNLKGVDWVFSRYLVRMADVVFWEVSQFQPDQITEVVDYLQHVTDANSTDEIEQVLHIIRDLRG